MTELITAKIQAIISIITLAGSFIFAQGSIIEKGFDQLFSIGLLIVAVLVIWKAFNRKDESETTLLEEKAFLYKEQAILYKEEIKTIKDYNAHLKIEIEELRKRIDNE